MIRDFLQDIGIICDSGRLTPGYIHKLTSSVLNQIMQSTSYLAYDAPIAVRIKCIQLDLDTQPTCRTCGTYVPMATSGSRLYTFPTYCSSKCFSSLPHIKRARELTCTDRYDASSYIGSADGIERRHEQLMKRYGVVNASQIPRTRADQTD